MMAAGERQGRLCCVAVRSFVSVLWPVLAMTACALEQTSNSDIVAARIEQVRFTPAANGALHPGSAYLWRAVPRPLIAMAASAYAVAGIGYGFGCQQASRTAPSAENVSDVSELCKGAMSTKGQSQPVAAPGVDTNRGVVQA